MIRRTARVLLIAVAALLISVAGLCVWLLHSDSGAAWIWARATAALPLQLSAADMQGSVSGGLQFRDVRYADTTVVVTANELKLVINLDLLPIGVTLEGLQAVGLVVELLESEASDEAESTAPALREVFQQLRLPVPVHARDLSITDATVVSAGEPVLVLEHLELDASLHEDLQIERLRYTTTALRATLSGSLELSDPFAVTAAIDADAIAENEDGSATPIAVLLELDGDFDKLLVDLRSSTHALTVNGSIADVDTAPKFDLEVNASELQWPLVGDEPAVALARLESQLTGKVSDYQVQFAATLNTAASGDVDGSGQLSGNLQGLQVQRLDLKSADAELSLDGELSWAEPFAAAAKINLQSLNPKRWLAAWPDQQFLSGSVDAALTGSRLQIAAIELKQSGGAAAVNAEGVIDLDNGVIDAGLRWSSLQWPLAPAIAEVDSREARLTITGTPENWTLSGDIAVGAGEYPEGRFTLTGGGTQEGMQLVLNDSQVLGGKATGKLAYSWIDENAFSAELQTHDLHTAALLPDWPGQISSQFSVSGQAAPFAMDLKISSLSGQLRSRPISAKGRVQLSAEQLRADALELRTGQSLLQLNGDWQSADGMRFVVDIDSLGDLLPAAAGRVQSSGRITAGAELPQVEIDLTADELRWQDWLAERVELRNAPSSTTQPLALALTVQNLVQGERTVDSAGLTLNGSLQQHTLALQLAASDLQSTLVLDGGLSDWQEPASAVWRGSLMTLSAQRAEDVAISLREPTPLSLASTAVSLGEACLVVAAGGDVCLHGDWASSGRYSAAFTLNAMPLDLLRIATGSDLEFTQTIDGTVEVETGAGGRVSGKGRIDITPGLIRNQFDERLTLRTRAGFASFQLAEGQLLDGAISLPFSDAAEISGQFRVLDVSSGRDSAVQGELIANIRDIGVGARIVPIVDDAKGKLDADIRIAGTLAKPLFSGGLTLRGGQFAYDPLGLRVEEIEIDSEILPGNRIELQTSFRAGEGRGKLSSSADYLQGRSAGLELALTGSNLTLINLNDLSVTIDPDLQLGLRNDDLSINGRIAIPAARLASVNLINAGESESDDVVFVGEEIPVEATVAESSSPLKFTGSVELELGDKVIIDLDIAEARLRGKTRFNWNGPALPTASGGIEVSGKFEAYGQLLEISEGNVRFPNVPADNPELRIRAEREIFGNSQVRRAGVLVSGTAQRPTIEVYTNPATSQDRAITLLATGSDFNYEQGVGAVDVGTYIAPKLYASYGIGLFDKENVISVRYDLANGFGLKATSGKRAAGVDISYTIER